MIPEAGDSPGRRPHRRTHADNGQSPGCDRGWANSAASRLDTTETAKTRAAAITQDGLSTARALADCFCAPSSAIWSYEDIAFENVPPSWIRQFGAAERLPNSLVGAQRTKLIDFSKINAFDAGQRESFEELICVLARRSKPNGALEYLRIEGSGGDGGLEALWIFEDGTKTAYQAKYFLSLSNKSWTQLDKSVKRAIEVHPELTKYIVALPCNLTFKRQFLGLRTSGWEKWKNRVENWSDYAKDKGLHIEFQLWTATDLTEQLLRDENIGLYQHWWGARVLNKAWFTRHVKAATTTLDDRYNPQEHVETTVESMFDCIVRGPLISQRIKDCFAELRSVSILDLEHMGRDHTHYAKVTKEVIELKDEVSSLQSVFSNEFSMEWNTRILEDSLKKLLDNINELRRILYSSDEYSDNKQTEKRMAVDMTIRKLIFTCEKLEYLLADKGLTAERTRCAIVHGPAGAGKSHLLGHIADQRVASGLPTILLLGQSFSNKELWHQIAFALQLPGQSSTELLGAINAAAERKGVRALFLIDAINEGAGAQYWREHIPDFINSVKPFSNISVVISCREEYLKFAIPGSVLSTFPIFHVGGFLTHKEMEDAAIKYLDAKGIARPNTPWLSVEFRNPLFLKSASETLQAKGETEFPRGLHGISELMSYYLDSLSWRTGLSGFDPHEVSRAIKRAVQAIAAHMADTGCDSVELETAERVLEECFSTLPKPTGMTWLNVLVRVSLLRRDPPPLSSEVDPLSPPSELVRFAFQRFQDHLMARTLVKLIESDAEGSAFRSEGPLNFLFYDGEPNKGIRYEFAGLIGSLSTIYPEVLGIEFAEAISEEADLWSEDHLLQEAFGESCKWRRTDAFSRSTLGLFNQLDDNLVDKRGLLLEVSITIGHPWNAHFLHSWLIDQPMPERDSKWTRWVNWSLQVEGSQTDRIISWALNVRHARTDIEHLELASIVLAWLLTSSHRTLRDRATKALSTVFLVKPSIFETILSKLSDCDDPYLIERLYASAYGACCIDQTQERLSKYSQLVIESMFTGIGPPPALLTRDYALGIVELAVSANALNSVVSLEECLPPYRAEPPQFGLSEEDVQQLADECGGREIFRSASSEWGDFGKYSVPGRVRAFLTVELTESKPVSASRRKELFFQEVIEPYADRVSAVSAFEEIAINGRVLTVRLVGLTEEPDPEVERQASEYAAAVLRAKLDIESLLSTHDIERFRLEYLREGSQNEEYERVDVQQCRLWITKRAYELGWQSALFPSDNRGSGHSRYENNLERIGKKYQRIALDELQARLADNFWALSGWPEQPATLRYTHEGFRRDLEPTVLPDVPQRNSNNETVDDWIVHPRVRLPDVAEDNLKEWPFEEDPSREIENKLVRIDTGGSRWMVLYEFNLDQKRYPEPTPGEHGMRYEEFRFLYCIFLSRESVRKFVEFIEQKRA